MRMKPLLLCASLALNAIAAEPVAPAAQPLAASPGLKAGGKAIGAGKAVVAAKINATSATRNADGSLEIGCTERANPKAKPLPINTPAPGARQ
jgi:hypothetical protein